MIKLSIGGPGVCLLIAFLVTSGNGHDHRAATASIKHQFAPQGLNHYSIQSRRLSGPADKDSLTPYEKYQDDLSSLIAYFGEKDFAIYDLLQDSRFEIYEEIGNRFRHSAEKKSPGLEEYKMILGYEYKRSKVIDFIHTHSDQLKRAEETYGVSGYVVSAIIGIESDFGKVVGKFNPFNSYVSMCAVGYRERFARAQLEELLAWAGKNNLDVFELKSSYAGAMGFAQFIPYSLNKWFIGDDIFDMNNNILSVANYLAYFKKRTGSIEGAVLRYNPSSLYTKAVLDLAKEAEDIISAAK